MIARRLIPALLVAVVAAPPALAAGGGSEDRLLAVLLGVTVVLLGAKVGGEVFQRLGQPAVLGELVAGILIGNLDEILGTGLFAALREGNVHDTLVLFSQLGAIFLLFDAGLEISVAQMMKVGVSAGMVGLAGVLAPLLLGFGVGEVLLPEASLGAHLFLGATLSATSVGITARVFRDLGRLDSPEARIILGAAVIDDVLGLILLAIVSGLVASGSIEPGAVAYILVVSLAFVAGAVTLGSRFTPLFLRYLGVFRVPGMKLVSALSFCFGFAWLAGRIGLAPIVGAFAAGLILEERHFERFLGEKPLHELLSPFSAFFVPIFFVLMGLEVRLKALLDPSVLGLAAAITAAAILGKQVCGLAIRGPGIDRWTIGFGMIPRGEVGLIFASVGRGLGVVDDALYAACVLMVVVTTFLAPILLQWRLRRARRAAP